MLFNNKKWYITKCAQNVANILWYHADTTQGRVLDTEATASMLCRFLCQSHFLDQWSLTMGIMFSPTRAKGQDNHVCCIFPWNCFLSGSRNTSGTAVLKCFFFLSRWGKRRKILLMLSLQWDSPRTVQNTWDRYVMPYYMVWTGGYHEWQVTRKWLCQWPSNGPR